MAASIISSCTSAPVSTLYSTITQLSTVRSTTLSTVTTVNPLSIVTETSIVTGLDGLPTLSTILSQGATVTTVTPVVTTATSTVLTSAPISTVFSSVCSAVSTSTPSTSSTTTSTSTLSSTSTITSTNGPSTITQTTTVPFSTQTSATALPVNRSSKTNVGAIAGGVVGGVVGLILLLLLIWFCCLGGAKRRNKDKDDFDFAQEKAWDPAAGVASSNRLSRNTSLARGPSTRSGAAYGSAAAAGAFAGAAATRGHQRRESTQSRKSSQSGHHQNNQNRRYADEQLDYYAHAIPPSENMAGVGLGRNGTMRTTGDTGTVDDGYSVVRRGNTIRRPQPPRIDSPPIQMPPPAAPGPAENMYSIPHVRSSSPLQAPQLPYAVAPSPAPSYRSIPGGYNPGATNDNDRTPGRLRVMNEEAEDEYYANNQVDERFGPSHGGVYDGLTAGLDQHDYNARSAPNYRGY